MGERHAGIAACRQGRRHAGHDFVLDARRFERRDFFARPGKDGGVAALESHHLFACQGGGDYLAIDFVLRQHPALPMPAQANQLGGIGRMPQQQRIRQIVVKHDLGLPEQLATAQRQQPWVAGACTY